MIQIQYESVPEILADCHAEWQYNEADKSQLPSHVSIVSKNLLSPSFTLQKNLFLIAPIRKTIIGFRG